jgi:hypothetical protein
MSICRFLQGVDTDKAEIYKLTVAVREGREEQVYICIYIYLCGDLCVYIYEYVNMNIRIYVYVYVFLKLTVAVREGREEQVCIHIYIYLCGYVYVNTHI